MESAKWVKLFFLISFILSLLICIINYIVDPYKLYDTNFIKNKTQLEKQETLVKTIDVQRIKPKSIILGTSRANKGYNPEHDYFIQPAYNYGRSGASIYEILNFLKFTLKNSKLEQALLVADWFSFNDIKMKEINDIETYNNINVFSYLNNTTMLKDSILNIKEQSYSIYSNHGQRLTKDIQDFISKTGGHLAVTKNDEKIYYKDFNTNYTYKDTGKSSFEDFKEILKICHENEVNLDIIFGPSHIRLWEAFAYYHDYELWLKWKKDVVLANEEVAKELGKKPFRIMDFSVYHALTSEPFPLDPTARMKYYWEASHYKSELGDIVLDRLAGKKGEFDDFGVELNSTNIDAHLQNLRDARAKFIDTKAYRKEVFGE